MKLTASQVDKAKPTDKPYKLFDGGGLFLLVNKNGSKYWRMRYRFASRDKTVAFGVYPDVTLKKARELRQEARRQLADDLDPAMMKQAKKRTQSGADSFESIAREWHTKNSAAWTPGHARTIIGRLERDVFPWVGKRHIEEVTAPDLLKVLQRVERRGAVDSAHRIKQYCSAIFRYAIATVRAERDPAADLRGALAKPKSRSLPGITNPTAVGALMRAIEGYEGNLITRIALQLAPLVFVRIGELRAAEWSEFDLDAGQWRIPAERMKGKLPHLVPLSIQAVELLREIQPLTGRGRFVFPSVRTNDRPMSENTVNGALRRLGYGKEEMTGHGFRTMASTLLNEQGWNGDAVERQLAHVEGNEVRAAYNYAEYLPERKRMMQAWADYLDSLKRGAQVLPIHTRKGREYGKLL